MRPPSRIHALIAAGHSAPEIARHLGVTLQAVYNAARRAGRTVAPAGRCGKPRSGVTLTPAGLDAIRAYELVHGLSSTLGGG